MKQTSSREKDTASGRIESYHGVLLSDLITPSLSELAPTEKAQVDLVILKSSEGAEVRIPRSLITKYPLILTEKDGALVLPWTSHPHIMSEGLPLQSYQITHVNEIELTSFHDRFATVFLRKRSDPSAVRGEKIFVQNCLNCHVGSFLSPEHVQAFSSAKHPPVPGAPNMEDRDRRALENYFSAYQFENPSRFGAASGGSESGAAVKNPAALSASGGGHS